MFLLVIPWLPRFILFSPGDLISNFPSKKENFEIFLINMHELTSNSQKNSKQYLSYFNVVCCVGRVEIQITPTILYFDWLSYFLVNHGITN